MFIIFFLNLTKPNLIDRDGLTGFKLDWSFERTSCPNFADFQEASEWAHDEMIRVTGDLNWNPRRRYKAQRRMENKIEYSRRRLDMQILFHIILKT